MLRILFISGLYSTPRAQWLGMPNARILQEMRREAVVKVVAPVPYYPSLLAPNGRARELSKLPVVDLDHDGSTLHHPRRLHVPGMYGLQAPLYVASVGRFVRSVVRDFRPDLVLSAWAYPDGAAAVALARWLGLPSVVRAMGSDINDFARKGSRRWQIGWALRRASRVVAVSRPLGEEIRKLGVPESRIEVIPTGVDTTRFHLVDRNEARVELGLTDTGPLILVPSRLSREKGVHYFIEALSHLDSGVRGVLVGDGGEEDSLRKQAAQLGLLERLTFAGFQPESRMKLYYSAADVTCLPSTEEGWPNVLMESMACGCPVVASDVGGVQDLIALTGDGIAVPPAQPDLLSAALRQALARDWDRDAMVRKMSPHTIQATGRAYLSVCRRVASGSA